MPTNKTKFMKIISRTISFYNKRKILKLIMKCYLFLFCTVVFGITPNFVNSQNAKLTIAADKVVTMDEVFDLIMTQTDYTFIYQVDLFKNYPSFAIKKGVVTVDELLKSGLSKGNFNVVFSDKNIFINSKNTVKKDISIKGKVTDEKGMPIPGATVLDKETGKGVVTDFNGEFEIITSNPEATIMFSFVGFVGQEIKVSGKTYLNVTLVEDNYELGEIVVTGYQSISQERVTGSFSKLKEKDFEAQRLSSLDAILEGRIVGYQNGVIRGTTSMNGLTTPLYVIDGFPIENTKFNGNFNLVESLPNLNLEDIETITVLKDAAAASIYGARAANGVVVITTKKAKVGKTTISFSSNFTVSPYKYYTGNLTDSGDIIGLEKAWATGNPKLQTNDGSAATYASSLLNNAVFTSQGMQTILNYYAGNLSESDKNNTLNRLGSMGYKYYDDIEKYAKQDEYFTQYNVSLGNASEKNSFNASITYKGEQFEDKYSDNESIGINLKNSLQVNKWLTLDIGTFISYAQNDLQNYDAFSPGFKYQPYNQLVNDDGTPFTSTAASRYSVSTLKAMSDYGLYNMDITPMDEFGRNLTKNKSFLNRTFAKANIQFSDAFHYNAMFQYEYGLDRINFLRDKDSYNVRSTVNSLVTISDNTAKFNLPYGDIVTESNQYFSAYNFRQQLDFDKVINGVNDISVIAGMEVRHSKLEFNDKTLYGWDDQTLTFAPVNQADLLKVYGSIFGGYLNPTSFSSARELINRYVSFYSNAGYTYDKRYSVTGSLRYDRSNLWGTDSEYQNKPTWSTGLAWNVNKESFFNASWVDMLKIRGSYGIAGNVAKNSAPYLTAYYSSNNNVGGIQGSINSRPNPQLSWEKTTISNVGLDFALFNNRLSGTFDFYNKFGEDLLANSNGIPTEGWGYSTYTLNNGEMTNKGLEVSLSGTIIKTPSFSWNAGILYAYNKNEVTYVNVEAPVYYLQLDYASDFPRIGKNYNSIYGYQWAGLSSTGLPQVNDASGNPVSFNPADLEAIQDYGTTVPIQSGSFNTAVAYKNFSLSALFIYQLGHKMKNTFLPMFNNNYNGAAGGYITDIAVVNRDIRNAWQQPGDEAFTNVPRVVYDYDPDFSSDLQSIYSYADINIIDASNLRLSNISLAYEMPSDLMKKVKLQSIRFNFNVENVFTVANSKDAKYLLGGYQSPNFVFGFNINF